MATTKRGYFHAQGPDDAGMYVLLVWLKTSGAIDYVTNYDGEAFTNEAEMAARLHGILMTYKDVGFRVW